MPKKVIEFVSYDGKYPTLCMGELVVNVYNSVDSFEDVEDFSEGAESIEYKQNHLNSVLSSGGSCGFNGDYDDNYCHQGEWEINEYELPDELKPYKEEIKKLVNDNIPWGCCGGCL